MILLDKKIYHIVENHVIEIHVRRGMTVVILQFEKIKHTHHHMLTLEWSLVHQLSNVLLAFIEN